MLTAAIVVSSCVGYLLVAGTTWTTFEEADRDASAFPFFAALLWPLTVSVVVPFWIAAQVWNIPARLIAYRNRVRLPKAQVVK